MRFEEIMANVENQFATKYAYIKDKNSGNLMYLGSKDIDHEFFIDKIVLKYCVSPIKDRKYEYMLIPVWTFYGGHDYGEGYELEDGTLLEGKHRILASLLTINAVDGSVITTN
jgi:hypothetical protein